MAGWMEGGHARPAGERRKDTVSHDAGSAASWRDPNVVADIQASFCPQFAVPLCHQSSFCELSSACQTFYTVCEKIEKFSQR